LRARSLRAPHPRRAPASHHRSGRGERGQDWRAGELHWHARVPNLRAAVRHGVLPRRARPRHRALQHHAAGHRAAGAHAAASVRLRKCCTLI
jgi:hypothetical protein